MTGEDGNEVLGIGAAAPGSLSPADLIADFAVGAEIVDLTGLIDSLLGGPAEAVADARIPAGAGATMEPAQPAPAAGEGANELAGLSGIGHTITILFDDTLNTGI